MKRLFWSLGGQFSYIASMGNPRHAMRWAKTIMAGSGARLTSGYERTVNCDGMEIYRDHWFLYELNGRFVKLHEVMGEYCQVSVGETNDFCIHLNRRSGPWWMSTSDNRPHFIRRCANYLNGATRPDRQVPRLRFEFIEKMKAMSAGYFWARCLLCDRMYGGHEGGGTLTYGHGDKSIANRAMIGVCAGCAEDAERRSRAFDELLGCPVVDAESHRFIQYTNGDDPRFKFMLEGCNHRPPDGYGEGVCQSCGLPSYECEAKIKEQSDKTLELYREACAQ